MNIGLSYTGSEEKHNNYIRWLQQDDKSIHIVALSADTKENKGLLEDCDALVLSGGVDMHPGYYNSNQLVYPNMPKQFNEKRDAFEKQLYLSALKRRLPVLGICRGLQLINCLEGGTLQQDLAARNSIHRAIIDPSGKQFDKAHGVHITTGSLLYDIANTGRAVVNSAHHQCTDIIADTLVVNCIADDQTVEGLEWKDKLDKPFLLCVQWHPERMAAFQLQDMALSKGIRNRFLEEVKKAKQK